MDILHPLLKTTWYLRSSKQWCSSSRKLVILFGRAGLAQWWEGSPATNVAQVGFLDPASYVGWVCCWFSTLFSGYSSFPLSLKTNISKFQLDPGMHGHFWMSSCELPGVPWVNKLHLHFFYPHRSSCYCFVARGIVSVVCSLVLSKGCKPFMWDLNKYESCYIASSKKHISRFFLFFFLWSPWRCKDMNDCHSYICNLI